MTKMLRALRADEEHWGEAPDQIRVHAEQRNTDRVHAGITGIIAARHRPGTSPTRPRVVDSINGSRETIVRGRNPGNTGLSGRGSQSGYRSRVQTEYTERSV